MRDRVVVDTNTFVSAILNTSSTPAQAVTKAIAMGTLLRSLDTWQELEDVLLREKFDHYRAVGLRVDYLEELRQVVEVVSVLTRIEACRHSKDDKFLELAVDGRADVIVTGDKGLLVLHPFKGSRL